MLWQKAEITQFSTFYQSQEFINMLPRTHHGPPVLSDINPVCFISFCHTSAPKRVCIFFSRLYMLHSKLFSQQAHTNVSATKITIKPNFIWICSVTDIKWTEYFNKSTDFKNNTSEFKKNIYEIIHFETLKIQISVGLTCFYSWCIHKHNFLSDRLKGWVFTTAKQDG